MQQAINPGQIAPDLPQAAGLLKLPGSFTKTKLHKLFMQKALTHKQIFSRQLPQFFEKLAFLHFPAYNKLTLRTTILLLSGNLAAARFKLSLATL